MDKKFYNENGITLAKNLLNKFLIREYDNKKIVTKIVETEAYMGTIDKAAHAYKNRKSTRTDPLYLSGGHIYVYLIYGMYNCLNLSANKENIPECVLIRAVEPINDFDEISYNRFLKPYSELTNYQKKNLTNGPGKLCKGLNIDRSLSGKHIFGNELYIEDNTDDDFEIVEDKRINIDYAQEDKDKLWRFYIKNNKNVSVINKQ
ncbi:MAG TPA: DNA-3-methyladenine glycosylase [Terrisporobacter glycolicus]|uniref:Putative 3-methyladenine DNA glycosylase n=1 Tax=Terrisporobacter petrolearius TaxID=1460447 RepID=A0ABZ3FBD6_9FIRM|nr:MULTISPECIES: DNA-3-methyladenine glycosylase [Terrisporobacter]MBN9647503.1 DNA-3-methyladenine glycosylase [Terrisporobacter glycolicus]HBI91507.1 DNA-3-methyladenine glycosylase [Terrisporobacter hibernicus]